MKKLLFTVVLGGLMMTPSVKGQVNPLQESVTPPEGQFYYGIKAGMNMAKITGIDIERASRKPLFGFNGGLYAGYMIAENLGVQSEVLVSTKGVKFSRSEAGTKMTSTINSTYIDVPVLLQYTFPIGIYLEGGPQFGFLVSSKGRLRFEKDGEYKEEGEDIYDKRPL